MRKIFTWTGTIPPSKTNCPSSQSCTSDVLTCRVFNTSRYHEPRPSKHRHSIPHNINHIAINMNHECMNMLYAQTPLTWLFDLVHLTSFTRLGFEGTLTFEIARSRGGRRGSYPCASQSYSSENIPHKPLLCSSTRKECSERNKVMEIHNSILG